MLMMEHLKLIKKERERFIKWAEHKVIIMKVNEEEGGGTNIFIWDRLMNEARKQDRTKKGKNRKE